MATTHRMTPPRLSALRTRLVGLSRRPVLHDVGTLASGVMAGRLIRIVSIPVIARLFDPDHFGQAAFLIAVATTLSTASTLRFTDAILLAGSHGEARQLSRLCWLVLALFVLLVAAVTAAWPDAALAAWVSEHPYWWLWVTVIVAVLGIHTIQQSWALRDKRYRWLAAGDVVEGSVSASGRIGWGAALGSSMTGLLVPFVAATALRAMMYAAGAQARPGTTPPEHHHGQERAGEGNDATLGAASNASSTNAMEGAPAAVPGLRETALRYRHFPLYGLPSTLMRTASERIPLLLLGAIFAPAVVGLYAAADRLVRLPVQGISKAIRKVIAQRAAVRRRDGISLFPILALGTGGLALAGALPFGAVAVYGKPLFAVALGERWAGAGDYAQVLALWGYSLFLVGPSNAILMVLEKQRSQLFVNTVRACLFVLVALLAITLALTPLRAVQCFAVAGVASNAGMMLTAFYMASQAPPPVAGGTGANATRSRTHPYADQDQDDV